MCHVFEKAGLGKAPFRLVGLETTSDRIALNHERQSNGLTYTPNYCTSCAYCATAIMDAYIIQSSDGKRFKVGCECVKKTGDLGIILAVKTAKAKKDREYRHAREACKLREGAELMADQRVRDFLSKYPHSKEWAAARGDTLLDEITWLIKNSGVSGTLRAYARVKNLIESRES